VTPGEDWFARLYADGYRGLLLTAYALLEDIDDAAAVTRDALAVAYERRRRLAQGVSPLALVRADVVRRARRRQRWRALPHRPPAIDRKAEAIRLHRLAGLSPDDIASIVDLPVDAVETAVAGAGPVSWASVRQPVVTRVRDRAAQRTTRKRMLVVATVAIAVLAVVVPLLRVEQAPAAAPPPSTSWTPPPPQQHRFITEVRFADENHAFALRADCPTSDCDLELLASDDGRGWTSRPVRKPAQPDPMMGGLMVLGPDEVAIDWFPSTSSSAQVYRVHTTDGGRTWASVSAVPRRSLSEIPDGAQLQPPCFGGGSCTDDVPTVVLPGTAESARLVSAPRLLQAYPGPVPLAGNRWWIAGVVPGTQQWAVAISDDRGRTWRTSRLARPRTNVSDAWSVTGYGDNLYACAMGEVTPGGDWAMVSIFHSGDGGRSWRPTNGPEPLRTTSALVAAADGTLLTSTENGDTLISRDNGRTFARTVPRFSGYAYWAGAGYVATSDPDRQILFSRDGLSWHELHLRS